MAYFAFTQQQGQEFIFELKDEAQITHARNILSGKEKERVHVVGRIKKSSQPYNPTWSYHLDPATIDFFYVGIEIADATMQYVEDHLDEVGGAFLPGGVWGPWDSRLVREVV